MSAPSSKRPRSKSLRHLAERQVTKRSSVDLEVLSPDEIRRLVHEMEVHKVELEIQNEQLRETQREAEEARDSYRDLYESAPIGFLTLDQGGTIVEANRFLALLLATPRARIVRRKLSDFIVPQLQDRWHREKRRVLAGDEVRITLDLELVTGKGETILVQLTSLSVGDDGAAPRQVRFAIMDVTALRKTERALRAAAAAASEAEEVERRKLASDLHDDAGQLLSLATLKLAAVAEAASPTVSGAIREVSEIVSDVRRRISSLSFQLSPPLLHDLGLLPAAQWLAEDLQRSYGLQVAIVDQCERELDDSARVTLFRVLRELLLNVAKHAGVKEARVRIWSEGTAACLAVEDAGVGLPPPTARHGFGLLALRERLELLGGTLETRSTPGGGATVVATLPIGLPQAG
jgi:PAS domain S-box-containing protein